MIFKRGYIKFIVFLSSVVTVLALTNTIFAASSGLGFSIQVENDFGVDGNIVSYKDGAYYLADSEYDPNMYGVLTEDSTIYVEDTNLTPRKLVVASGDADVTVSTVNGPIKKGDFITSSKKPGIGMKATSTGQVVGIAQQDFESTNPEETGKILVFVDIRMQISKAGGASNVLTALKAGLDATFLSPLISLRYILAALVAGVSFIIGFRAFGKISGSSIEALGRNPLASSHIKKVVVFNFVLTFALMLGGLVVAYLILVL